MNGCDYATMLRMVSGILAERGVVEQEDLVEELEELYRRVDEPFSDATVYRVLDDLKFLRRIRQVGGDVDWPRYRWCGSRGPAEECIGQCRLFD